MNEPFLIKKSHLKGLLEAPPYMRGYIFFYRERDLGNFSVCSVDICKASSIVDKIDDPFDRMLRGAVMISDEDILTVPYHYQPGEGSNLQNFTSFEHVQGLSDGYFSYLFLRNNLEYKLWKIEKTKSGKNISTAELRQVSDESLSPQKAPTIGSNLSRIEGYIKKLCSQYEVRTR